MKPTTRPLTWAQRRDRALRDAAAQCLADPAASESDVQSAMAVLERGPTESLDALSGELPPWFLWQLSAMCERLQAERDGAFGTSGDDT